MEIVTASVMLQIKYLVVEQTFSFIKHYYNSIKITADFVILYYIAIIAIIIITN